MIDDRLIIFPLIQNMGFNYGELKNIKIILVNSNTLFYINIKNCSSTSHIYGISSDQKSGIMLLGEKKT